MVQSLLGGHNDSDESASIAPLLLASDNDTDEDDKADTHHTQQQESQPYPGRRVEGVDSRQEGGELSTEAAAVRSPDEWDLMLGPSGPSPQLDGDGSALRSGPEPEPEPAPDSGSESESDEDDLVEQQHAEQAQQQRQGHRRPSMVQSLLGGHNDSDESEGVAPSFLALADESDDDNDEQRQDSTQSADNRTDEKGEHDEDEDPFEMLRKLLPDSL